MQRVVALDERSDEREAAKRSRELARERVRKRFPNARDVVDEFLAERRAEAAREAGEPEPANMTSSSALWSERGDRP